MSRSLKSKFVALMLAFCTLSLISCDKDNGTLEPLIEGVKLEQGAVIQENNGVYSNLNLVEDKYTKAKVDGVIIDYDFDSNRYIYLKDGKHYIFYDGKVDEVSETQYSCIKISPGGKYISYFIDNEGLELKFREVGNNKYIEFKSNVAISGYMIDWLDEKRLVYYGVDADGNNGVFTYNIEANEEKLVYKLDDGFIQFIKSTHTGVIFLQEHNDKGLVLKRLSADTGEVEVLTEDLVRFSDIVERDKEVYILGKAKNDIYSLYRIDGTELTRLVYDFPWLVKESTNESKKLSIDKQGNILFVGIANGSDKEEVYSFSKDGTIKSLTLGSGGYSFLN